MPQPSASLGRPALDAAAEAAYPVRWRKMLASSVDAP